MTIYIANPDALTAKRQQFIIDGPENLHIVADFDGTLTRAKVGNQKIHSTLAVLREGGYLNPEYVKESFALADKYRPIERDPTIDPQERLQHMQSWWEEHLELKIKHGMNKAIIEEIIAKRQVQGREGLKEFITLAHEGHIPLLILSAGLGDVIKSYLQAAGVLYPNVHIISNFYSFDAEGKVTGYKSKIIHSFNKSEVAIHDTPYAHDIRERKNVLLLGDSIGDADMAHGMHHEAVIKIGFLNGEKEKLEAFAKVYDVVILEDIGLTYVHDLLKEIT